MYTASSTDDFSLAPVKEDIRSFSWSSLRSDLLAGLEVSLLTVPQAVACSLVAGLPISCGLFAAILPAILGAFSGSSRYLVIGPINAIAILLQVGTADIVQSHYWEASPVERDVLALDVMVQIALLAGMFQLLIAVFKLGRMTQFVSQSVVFGYLAGASLAVIINQLFTFGGISPLSGVNSLYQRLSYLSFHLGEIHLPTLIIGLSSLVLLLTLKKIGKRLPAAAIMLTCAAGACFVLSYSPYLVFSRDVALLGSTTDHFNMMGFFSWPTFDWGLMNHMLGVAFAVALLGIIETTCSAKSIAATSGKGISINQEILSVGLANVACSCTGSMPVSVSTSRSQANLQSGARTRLAAIFNGIWVAIMVGYLGTFINWIPLAALSALIFVTAVHVLNPKLLLICLKSTWHDAMVMLITFTACIFFNLDTAFYIGVILSISLYLKKAAMPQLVEYAIEDSGELRSLELPKAYLQKTIRVIKVEGELFFGSADIFYTTLKTLAEDDQTTRVILLQLKNARDMDGTTCLSLLQLQEYLERAGRHLVMCGMTHEMWDVMSNSGLIAKIGKENLFLFDERHPQLYMQKAIARAKDLARQAELPPTTVTPIQDLAPELA